MGLSNATAFIVVATLIYMPHSWSGLPPPHPTPSHPLVLVTVELCGGWAGEWQNP